MPEQRQHQHEAGYAGDRAADENHQHREQGMHAKTASDGERHEDEVVEHPAPG
jgi:hypothetical protein